MARRKISLVRWMISIIIMVPLVFVWTMFLSKKWMSYEVISASMAPTLQVGDCVIMKSEADFQHLKDQIIAFKDPHDKDQALTKRVVAEENSTVQVWNGQIYVDKNLVPGEPLTDVSNQKWDVPAGHVFVMGDNRNNSNDSIDYGPIARKDILGVLIYRYWPWARHGPLNTTP